jgi:aspartokinase-like uncharacterized kinase
VVKFGGSLFACASTLVPVLAAAPGRLLVVPGGGPFADTVRQRELDDDAAHWMACGAMEQYGQYLSSLGLPAVDSLAFPARPSVLLPYALLRARDPLPHTWEVTSDTIAAWCAAELGCDLVLAKSVDGIVVGDRLVAELEGPVPTDAVDPHLVPFALSHGLRVRIVNARVPGRLARALRGETVPGTTIDPSLFERRT